MKRDFKVTILGSNSAIPNYKSFSSSQVIKVGNNFFLIDAGEGVQIQLRRFAIKYFSIKNIFISHLHGDHFFGIFGLLSSYNLLHRKDKLNIYAPDGLSAILKPVFFSLEKLCFPLEIIPLKKGFNKIFENDDLSIYSFELKHSIPTWGFLFEEKQLPPNIIKEKIAEYKLTIPMIKDLKKGLDIYIDGKLMKNQFFTIPPPKPRKYAYMSDTQFVPELADILKDVDLLYHEATYTEKNKELAKKTMHSTALEAAEFAKISNAKKLLIGHFSQRNNFDEYLSEAKKIFPDVIAAYDGLVLDVYSKQLSK